MSRYDVLDTDEERLPDGMERVGYDAEEQRYTYRDAADGSLWRGAEGARYGRLERTGEVMPHAPSFHPPSTKEALRYLLPFFLLICVFLLGVYYLLSSPSVGTSIECFGTNEVYVVKGGDSCWAIADARRSSVEELLALNPGLRCEGLGVGRRICVPGAH
ncbi:carbohydrate-binding module family 50 protein [Aulographum hederae CBS 113979]|uniref:Carbohydrate-binding module family 50 protein n=1 Tax=Aulographum hederae CBS 113979 TaxID=1176131 RepID=A0A6G1GTW1_9PEZI|nr:carbohydrate-binding module family 50 protein [Aulographum hederae CBS 113979]